MTPTRVAFKHFWSGFQNNPRRLRQWEMMFPNLCKFDLRDVTSTEEEPEVVFFSHFFGTSHGTRRGAARGLEDTGAVRVFWTGENEEPPDGWDYAMTHSVTFTQGPYHLRTPHWYPWLNLYHPEGVNALIRKPDEVMPKKDRDVIFLCSHDTPERTAMVKALRDAGLQVDCYGKTKHNNTEGAVIARGAHYNLISRYRFALTFENESAPGYCTEKIADAFAARTVPIYQGYVDPAFSISSVLTGDCISAVVAMNKHNKSVSDMANGWCLQMNELPEWATPEAMTAWWSKVLGREPAQ